MKTEIHKITIMVADLDHLGADNVTVEIENARFPNDCVTLRVVSVETESIDFPDNHPLNQRSTWRAAFERLFSKDRT